MTQNSFFITREDAVKAIEIAKKHLDDSKDAVMKMFRRPMKAEHVGKTIYPVCRESGKTFFKDFGSAVLINDTWYALTSGPTEVDFAIIDIANSQELGYHSESKKMVRSAKAIWGYDHDEAEIFKLAMTIIGKITGYEKQLAPLLNLPTSIGKFTYDGRQCRIMGKGSYTIPQDATGFLKFISGGQHAAQRDGHLWELIWLGQMKDLVAKRDKVARVVSPEEIAAAEARKARYQQQQNQAQKPEPEPVMTFSQMVDFIRLLEQNSLTTPTAVEARIEEAKSAPVWQFWRESLAWFNKCRNTGAENITKLLQKSDDTAEIIQETGMAAALISLQKAGFTTAEGIQGLLEKKVGEGRLTLSQMLSIQSAAVDLVENMTLKMWRESTDESLALAAFRTVIANFEIPVAPAAPVVEKKEPEVAAKTDNVTIVIPEGGFSVADIYKKISAHNKNKKKAEQINTQLAASIVDYLNRREGAELGDAGMKAVELLKLERIALPEAPAASEEAKTPSEATAASNEAANSAAS